MIFLGSDNLVTVSVAAGSQCSGQVDRYSSVGTRVGQPVVKIRRIGSISIVIRSAVVDIVLDSLPPSIVSSPAPPSTVSHAPVTNNIIITGTAHETVIHIVAFQIVIVSRTDNVMERLSSSSN